jgi:uncharacterized protein YydD (DUF2326 family)
MKLSKLYTDNERIFPSIFFNDGLNVVYAKINNPLDDSKDSHNLGKTFLINVIDYLLLKQIKKGNAFAHLPDFIANLTFYLEVKLNNGTFLTISRNPNKNTKISFKAHTQKHQDFTSIPESEWDHQDVPLTTKAVGLLDSYLNLNIIKPWDYRQGVTYFLRKQKDYLDVFQISKFTAGSHKDWKPYIGKLLGLDNNLIYKKYEIESQIEKHDEKIAEQKSRSTVKLEDYDKVKATIDIKNEEISAAQSKIDQFDFHESELEINEDLVKETEEKVSNLNNHIYNINFDIKKVSDSLKSKIEFNTKEVKAIFEDVGVHFPDNLTKKYDELLEFNKKVTIERSKHLKERLTYLEQLQKEKIAELEAANTERQDQLRLLREKDTFKKYHTLQDSLVKSKAHLNFLGNQLKELDKVILLQKDYENLEKEKKDTVELLEKNAREEHEALKEIRLEFNRIFKEVLSVNAILYTNINSNKNIDFEAVITETDEIETKTSESDGTSYKKLLCATFDLAVLNYYKDKEFYKFVYHDGILEGLDDRKKIKLLNILNQYTTEKGIQYILTTIDADLPRDANDNKVEFDKSVIIRELNDDGDDGRLFKGPKF